jgi:DNA-directed RNA polymerase specialized sigma24 family protein
MYSIHETHGNPPKNFGLKAGEFDELLERLLHGDEKLFEIIFKSHFDVCRNFLIRKMGADPDVAYDITLDVLVKFRRNLLAGKIKYGNLAALFTIDARNAFLRWSEKSKKQESYAGNADDLDLVDHVEDSPDDMENVNSLKIALGKVGNDCYELLNWHYYLEMPMKTIADKRSHRGDDRFLNEAAVKTKIAECRKKIRQLMGLM